MIRCCRSLGPLAFLLLLAWLLLAPAAPFQTAPASAAGPERRADAPVGQITWAVHASLVPSWFDPAEMFHGTPFMVLYAVHDALTKRMPGKSMAPSLAESWSTSPDGLVYEFVLAFLHGVGSRVEESGLGLLGGYGFSAPYEDVKLKGK